MSINEINPAPLASAFATMGRGKVQNAAKANANTGRKMQKAAKANGRGKVQKAAKAKGKGKRQDAKAAKAKGKGKAQKTAAKSRSGPSGQSGKSGESGERGKSGQRRKSGQSRTSGKNGMSGWRAYEKINVVKHAEYDAGRLQRNNAEKVQFGQLGSPAPRIVSKSTPRYSTRESVTQTAWSHIGEKPIWHGAGSASSQVLLGDTLW